MTAVDQPVLVHRPGPAASRSRRTAPVTVRLVEPAEHHAVAALLVEAYGADYDISVQYRQTLEAVPERAAEHEVWVAVGTDGETLTRHVLDLARARGASRVVMNSGPQMISAHRLYHRLGFSRFHERETRVLDDGTRLFAFVLELTDPAVPDPAVPGTPADSARPAASAPHLPTDPRTAKA